MSPEAQQAHDSRRDDTPVSFGYKSSWIAIPSTDGHAIAETLGLTTPVNCSWEDGIAKAYDLRGVFITPPVDGWTLAVGSLPEVSEDRFAAMLERLSRQFGQAYNFATHRIVEYHAWAIAENGKVRRVHAWLGEAGEFLSNMGERTPDEIELEAGIEDFDQPPSEETVLELASRWSIDPRELEQYADARGPGLFGTIA